MVVLGVTTLVNQSQEARKILNVIIVAREGTLKRIVN